MGSEMCIRDRYTAIKALYAWVIRGNLAKAEKFVELAVRQCREYGDFVVEGIASEIMAGEYRSIGENEKAKRFLDRAGICYSTWGATGLLNKIRKMYPELVSSEADVSLNV